MLRRSQLYVPGNNEKMIRKAASLEADSVVLDLEDAVPSSEKDRARALVLTLARELDWGKRELCIRVNPIDSVEFAGDMSMARRAEAVSTVVVPKAEGDCSSISTRSGKSVIPIIETARGLMRLGEISRSKGMVAMTYGAADFAASVGGSVSAYLDNEAIKTIIVAAARSAGVEALDNVFFDLDNQDGFRRQAVSARSLGFSGKQVIHPSQIAIANEVFSPSKEEIAWARRVLAEIKSADAAKRGAIRVDGRLVDAVHYRIAKGIVERSELTQG